MAVAGQASQGRSMVGTRLTIEPRSRQYDQIPEGFHTIVGLDAHRSHDVYSRDVSNFKVTPSGGFAANPYRMCTAPGGARGGPFD